HAKALTRRVAAGSPRSACFFVFHDSESVFGNTITHFGDEIITGFRHLCSAAASPASPASPASAFGARLGRGGGVAAAFLPSVRISVIRTSVYSWRWL